MSRVLSVAANLWSFVVLSSTFIAYAQSTATVSFPRFSTFEGGIDSVNVGSLEVGMIVPLYGVHRRGSGTDESISLQYNSGIATIPTTIPNTNVSYSPNWSLITGSSTGARATYTAIDKSCGNASLGGTRTVYQYYFTDQRGVTHSFPGNTYTACSSTPI